MAVSTCIETPVAPIRWPLALRPPNGLTGSLPPLPVQPSRMVRLFLTGGGEAHGLVLQELGDGEAVVGLDQVEVGRLPQALVQPSKATISRLLIGRKSLTCAHERNATRLLIRSAVSTSASTRGGFTVGDQGTVGTLERAGDDRVLVRDVPAEFVADPCVAAPRGGAAVLVVLGGDRGQRVGLVAVPLEVALRDLAEHAGEPALDPFLLVDIGAARRQFSPMAGPAVRSSSRRRRRGRCALASITRGPGARRRNRWRRRFLDPVAGLKRRAGSAWSTSELVKSWAIEAAVEVAEPGCRRSRRARGRRRRWRPWRPRRSGSRHCGPRACRTAGVAAADDAGGHGERSRGNDAVNIGSAPCRTSFAAACRARPGLCSRLC